MSCCGALCLVRAEAPCDLGLLVLLLAVDSSGSGVCSGDADRALVVAFALALGAGVDELLALECPAVVLAFALALGAGVDELLDPVLGVGNAGAGFKCEYTGNAP